MGRQESQPVADSKAAKQKRVRPLLEPKLQNDASGDHANNTFARALGSVDYMTREKGLQALQRWMQRQQEISMEDMKKIWKGLFYCFWASDKAPVQEMLAERLAAIHQTLNPEMGYNYFAAFIVTMRREWFGIDRLRLDKYLMLVRKMVSAMFSTLSAKKWNAEQVMQYANFLRASLLVPKGDDFMKALGLTFHMADLFVPELFKVEASCRVAAPSHAWEALLSPFCEALVATGVPTVLARIREGVFDALLEELRNPSEKDLLKNFDSQWLSTHLFDLGAQPSTPTKNRAVLYAMSDALEKAKKKKMRLAVTAAAATQVEPSAPPTASPSQAEDTAAPLKSAKKKKLKRSGLQAAVEEGDKPPETVTQAAEPGPTGKKGKKKQATPPSPVDAVHPAPVPVPAPESDAKAVSGGSKKRKLSLQGGGGDAAANGTAVGSSGKTKAVSTPNNQDTPSSSGLDSMGSGKQGKSSVKKQQLRDQQQQEVEGTPVTGKSMKSSGGGSGKSKQGTAAAPPLTSGKKKVKINLKNNLYFAFGGPVPDRDIVTPPPAKPKGSILKKSAEEIPLNMPKSAPPAQRKSNLGGNGSDKVKVHMAADDDAAPQKGGSARKANLSPKNAPRARAGLFF